MEGTPALAGPKQVAPSLSSLILFACYMIRDEYDDGDDAKQSKRELEISAWDKKKNVGGSKYMYLET